MVESTHQTASRVLAGRFEVHRRLGHGGMSTVHLGFDRNLKRQVAIKILHPGLADDENARLRFEREAEAVASLTHPGILKIHDRGVSENAEPFIVMEFVDGCHLAEFVKNHPPKIPEAVARIAATMIRSLQAAHEAGVIHRDFKPENVMVARDGRVLLTDFGIAHVMGLTKLTLTGSLVGSPAHMAPEIIEGAVDGPGPSADIFAVGTVVYSMLTGGRLPFSGRTPHEVLKRVFEGKYTDVRTHAPLVGQEMASFVDRCMAHDPKDRFPSAEATADAVEQLCNDEIPSTPALVRSLYETPEETGKSLLTTLTRRLEKELKTARKNRQITTIAETTNRLLTLDGNHPDARAALRELSRTDSRKRWAKLALIIAVLVTVAVEGFIFFRPAPSAPPGPAVTVEISHRNDPEPHHSSPRRAREESQLLSTPNAVATVGGPFQARDQVGRKGSKSSEGAPRQGRAAKTNLLVTKKPLPNNPRKYVAQTRRPAKIRHALIPVTIFAFPPAAKILVDGRFRAFGRVENLKLQAGKHRVELHHPECKACAVTRYDITIDPERPPNRAYRFQIKFRPATLEVKTQGPAKVFLDDKYIGPTRTALTVPINNARGRKVRVRVTSRDKVFKPRNIVLLPGEKKTLSFTN